MIGSSAVVLNKYEGSDRPNKHAVLDIYRKALDGGRALRGANDDIQHTGDGEKKGKKDPILHSAFCWELRMNTRN